MDPNKFNGGPLGGGPLGGGPRGAFLGIVRGGGGEAKDGIPGGGGPRGRDAVSGGPLGKPPGGGPVIDIIQCKEVSPPKSENGNWCKEGKIPERRGDT